MGREVGKAAAKGRGGERRKEDEAYKVHGTVIREVLEEVQRATDKEDRRAPMRRLLQHFMRFQKDDDTRKFMRMFVEHLRLTFLCPENHKAADRVLIFASEFAINTGDVGKMGEEGRAEGVEEEEEGRDAPSLVNTLLTYFVTTGPVYTDHSNKIVRIRLCFFFRCMLECVRNASMFIADDTWEMVEAVLLRRVRDKIARVQIHAIAALSMLAFHPEKGATQMQDAPTKAIVDHMLFDHNADVRAEAVRWVNVNKFTLNSVLQCKRDASPIVRRTLYAVLRERVGFKAVKHASRMSILHCGLSDPDLSVQKECRALVYEWVDDENLHRGSIPRFLSALNVISERPDDVMTIRLTLNAIFRRTNDRQAVQALVDEPWWDAQRHRPLSLSLQQAIYWRYLVEYVKTEVEEARLKAELLEKLLPRGGEGNSMVDFFSNFVKESKEAPPVDAEKSWRIYREMTEKQLLWLLAQTDDGDDFTSNQRLVLLKYLIEEPSTNVFMLDALVTQLMDWYHTDTLAANPLLRPHQDSSANAVAYLAEYIGDLVNPVDPDADIDATVSNAKLSQSESYPDQQEVPLAQVQEATLIRCMFIASAMLAHRSVRRFSATLQTLLDSLILPGIMHAHTTVRKMAFKSLGLCGILDKVPASNFLHTIIMAAQNEGEVTEIRQVCQTAALDILMVHSHSVMGQLTEAALSEATLRLRGEDGVAELATVDVRLRRMSWFVDFYLGQLVSVVEASQSPPEIRTTAAESLAKLFIHDQVRHPPAVAALLLVWYNSRNKDTPRLVDCLYNFLRVFPHLSRPNQDCLEQALWLALDDIVAAPHDSPLKDNLDSLADFILYLTRSDYLKNRPDVSLSLSSRLLRVVQSEEEDVGFVGLYCLKARLGHGIARTQRRVGRVELPGRGKSLARPGR